ncbi:hypothetical protein C1645_879656 [Glomus cerebriforme]|uniref:Uncharacterized protein n=1 Tax=Glomus cerebriforme TaxID=658196 RepID=A0A397SLB6_9GLOM|nr:hypothetical protein C1645_879656 [Glomus cerebriforme]
MAFPALKEYCNILERLENHYIEEESQRGRHLFKLLTWSVVDSKLFPAQDPIYYPDLLRPTVNFGIIVAALKDTQHRKLHDAIPVLNRVIKEGKVGIVQSGITGTIQRWLGLEPADFIIDAPTALSALTSVLLFAPLPFEVGGVQVHKDFVVVFAEAAHALSRILSTHTFSESEISLIRVHIALVNNSHIRLGILRPLYNQECGAALYIYYQDIKCFELQSDCTGTDIENVLNLIVYLRQVVCKDGLYLRNLGRRTSGKKREFYCELPRLPSKAEKSRVPKVNFTPKAKRIRYEMCSTEDKRNDSAYYYGNYSVLLEEENVNQQVVDPFLTGSSSMKIIMPIHFDNVTKNHSSSYKESEESDTAIHFDNATENHSSGYKENKESDTDDE